MSSDLERLIGRAVTDADFREKLVANPKETIGDSGLSLTEEEIERVVEGVNKSASESNELTKLNIW